MSVTNAHQIHNINYASPTLLGCSDNIEGPISK